MPHSETASGELPHEDGSPQPFEQRHRSSGDLAHPVMEPESIAPTIPAIESESGDGANTVREDIEGSLHFLNFSSNKPAVLLARAWTVSGIPFAFQHLPLYREVAEASHCSLVEIVRQEAGGLEHLVFAARIRGLTDEEYLACIEEDPGART